MDLYDFYVGHPQLGEYFRALPMPVRNRIIESGVGITTLGELKQCAEHFREQLEPGQPNHL